MFRICLIVRWRCGASKIDDSVKLHRTTAKYGRERIGDVRLDEFKTWIALQVPQIFPPSGKKAVDANDVVGIRGEDVAEV
jgi:hypothetical protein